MDGDQRVRSRTWTVSRKLVPFCATFISALFLFNPYTHVLSGFGPKEALRATSYPCGVGTLCCCVGQKRTEAQNTSQDVTTQYLKGNAFVVSNNYESEISSLSQSPHSKRKKYNKINPISKAIEKGVKVSVISFAASLSVFKLTHIASAASIASSRTGQEEIPSKCPRLLSGNEFHAEESQGDK